MGAFLLWNVHRKPLDGLVQSLVRRHQIDVALLVEYPFGISQLPALLMKDGLVKRTNSKRFGVFVRSTHRLSPLRYRLGSRVRMWKWVPPSGQEGLIVLLHGLDRRNYDDSTRRVFFRRIADAVRRRERKQGHGRTVIAGDFNAQPFEAAIVDSDGLHAIGVRAVRTSTAHDPWCRCSSRILLQSNVASIRTPRPPGSRSGDPLLDWILGSRTRLVHAGPDRAAPRRSWPVPRGPTANHNPGRCDFAARRTGTA